MKIKSLLKVFLYTTLFVSFTIPSARAAAAGTALPSLSAFVAAVMDGQSGVVRGVYVPEVFAYVVVQQPADDTSFVSPNDGVVTQYGLAGQYGAIGLLAHDYLAGALFSNLSIGQELGIVYGDGRVEFYMIGRLDRYQALQPENGASDLIDLATGIQISSNELFAKYYEGGDHVTFQTCIFQDGNLNWGRLLVTALPEGKASTLKH
jgi:hypothetical protein